MEQELFTITKKSSFAFTGRITGAVFAFLFNLLAARYMGAEIYGQVMYVFNILLFFAMFARMGMNSGLIYLMPALNLEEKRDKLRSMVSFSLSFSFLLAVIFIIILWLGRNTFAVFLGKTWLEDLLLYMAPLIPMLAFLELSKGIFSGVEIIRYFVIGENLLLPFLKMSLVILAGILGYKMSGLIATYYLSYIAVTFYLLQKLLKFRLPGRMRSGDSKLYLRLIKFSFPLLISGMLSFFIGRLDIFMLGYYLGAGEVGIYNIALRIGTLSSIVLMSFKTIFAPVISSLYHRQKKEEMAVLYKTVSKWITGINLIALSLIFIFSEDIMRVFGGEFTAGALALIIIAVGEAFNAGVGPAETIIIMTGYSVYEFYISIHALIINAVLNLFLIPRYGLTGAAVTTLITLVFINGVRLILTYHRHHFLPFSKGYLKVIGAAVAATIFTRYFSGFFAIHYIANMFISFLFYVLVFISINFLFGISTEDKLVLEKVKGRMRQFNLFKRN